MRTILNGLVVVPGKAVQALVGTGAANCFTVTSPRRLRHGHVARNPAWTAKMSVNAIDNFSNAGGL
jgi:hypothetical protein